MTARRAWRDSARQGGRRSLARVGVYYAALFAGSGASMPFMPLWFQDQGLGPAQISAILAAPYFTQIVFGTVVALAADGFRRRRTGIAAVAACAALAYLALALVHGFWAWMATWFVAVTLMVALGPLSDVVALRESRARGYSYALPRGIGSAAYLIGNLAMGALVVRFAPSAIVAWTITAAALAAVMALLALPPTPTRDDGARPSLARMTAGLGGLLRDRVFVLCLLAAGLILASHAFYNSFSTLIWERQGLHGWAGALWATAAASEILFMWLLEPWRRRLGAPRLLIVGGLGAGARWVALSLSPPLWLLFPLQGLHALSFAATFLAALRLIERLSSPDSAAAAQTMNAALSNGVLVGLATALSGPLFAALGAGGYLAMAGVAGVGVALAMLVGRLAGNRLRPDTP
jgi:PPP family 3-phenylpropionic acid transporter